MIVSTLLYGAETWTLKALDGRRLTVFHNHCVHWEYQGSNSGMSMLLAQNRGTNTCAANIFSNLGTYYCACGQCFWRQGNLTRHCRFCGTTSLSLVQELCYHCIPYSRQLPRSKECVCMHVCMCVCLGTCVYVHL